MDKLSVLETCGFYREAAPPIRARIAEAGTYVTLPPGEIFYSEGETSDYFGIVGRGDIRVFKSTASGKEMTLYHVQAGQLCLVNIVSLYLARAAMASAVVESATEAVVFDGPTLRHWLDDHGVRNFVFEAIACRMVDVMALVEEIAFDRMERRVAGLLLQRFSRDRSVLATHEELAVELGTAREVISRTLKDFERSGAISMARGRLELRDPSRLRDLFSRP